MNKTAELVRLWALYEEKHPDAELKDFFSDQLLASRHRGKTKFLAGMVPEQDTSVLAKLLGRLVKLHTYYAMLILKEIGIGSFEEFALLNTMLSMDKPRKSEVINNNFLELSSGLLVLERLKAKGYITEEEDEKDKRSKRVWLLAKGKSVIRDCHKKMDNLNNVFYHDLNASDIRLCTEILKPLEMKTSSQWLKRKRKGTDKFSPE